jgi:PAS domain S-box-containing protein
MSPGSGNTPIYPPAGDLEETLRRQEELARQFRHSLDELLEIQTLSRIIRDTNSPEEILAGLDHVLSRVLPAPELGLFLLEGEELRAVGDPSVGVRQTLAALQEDGVTAWVLEEQRPISVPRLDDAAAESGDLLVPLSVMNQGIGVLLIRSLQPEEELTGQQLELVSFAAWQAAMALENSRLVAHLEDTRRQLQDMIDNAGDLILLVDDEGRISYANARTEALGEPRERLVGRVLTDFAESPEEGRRLEETIRRRERGLLELNLCNPATGGGPVPIQLSSSPLAPTHPSEATVLLILRDLTERRRLEAQAREAETLRAVMLAAVAVNHEINNPLTAIVGNLFLLRREIGEEGDPRLLQRLELMERSARQIEEVVRRLEQVTEVRAVRYLGETDMLDLGASEPEREDGPDKEGSGT